MFDLNREVAVWSATVHAAKCQPASSVAELSDHLYCEIDHARAEGLSDEQAFRAAIAKLGSVSALTAEHSKNRSALGTACQVAAKLDGGTTHEHRRLLTAHAFVWAALMIASALLLTKPQAPEISSWLLTGIFMPLWWASDQLMRAALRQRSAGV